VTAHEQYNNHSHKIGLHNCIRVTTHEQYISTLTTLDFL